jgi:hypothetical protein
MIAPQPPPLPVFIPVQAMADADMPSQHLAAVAAIETNHVVMAYRLSHRHGGITDFLRLGRLPKLTERPMY